MENGGHINIDDRASGKIVLTTQNVLVGLLMAILSLIYLKWNNYAAASRDATTYAAKIRQRQRQQEQEAFQVKKEDINNSQQNKTPGTETCTEQNPSQLPAEMRSEESAVAVGDDMPKTDISVTNDPNDESKKEMASQNSSANQGKEKIEEKSKSTPTRNTLQMNSNNNQWRCACEGGFLPPGMLGGAEAVFRMGTGQCYHKQSY